MTRPTRRQVRRRRVALSAGILVLAAAGIMAALLLDGGAPAEEATSATSASTAIVGPTSTAPETVVPTGRFRGAPGGSEPVGDGEPYTYTVEVEEGIDIEPDDFARAVDRILGDHRGWTADGRVALQRVPPDVAPSFRIRLATPPTTDRLCAPLETNGTQSCRQGENVVINLVRWIRGAEPSELGLSDYRAYLVSHEVGHALGHDHVDCPGPGVPAPVMVQQTLGIGGCAPNPWPFAPDG